MRTVFQNLAEPNFYRKNAEAQHVPLIGYAITDVLSDPKMKGDTPHPNAEGDVRLAEKIFKALQSIGYCRRKNKKSRDVALVTKRAK